MFILETWGEMEKMGHWLLGFSMAVIYIYIYSYINICTRVWVFSKISLLWKLPVQTALTKKLNLSSYAWIFCNHGGPNQCKASRVRTSMETVPQAKQVHCKKHQNCCVRDQWQRGLWGREHLLDQKRVWVRHFGSAGQLKKIPLPKAMIHAFLWLRDRYVQKL